MNPDVPNLEACSRLPWEPDDVDDVCHWWWLYAPCGWVLWWGVWSSDEYRNSYSDRVYAPTIGEMLAEIRRRGWSYIIRHGMDSMLCEVEVRRCNKDGNFPASKANSATHEEPKEALANALAEAMERKQP